MVARGLGRLNKRLSILTYDGGSAQADALKRVVKQRRTKQLVSAAAPGLGGRNKRRRDEYESLLKPKINNPSVPAQVTTNLKLAEHFEEQQGPAKKTKRVVKIDGIKQEELRQARSSSLIALEKELERLTQAGEK